MNTEPKIPATRPARLRTLAFAAVVVALVTGAGLIYAVHAEWRPAPVIQPYDPLPRW